MKNYKKIAIIGSHSAGKSTFALRLAYHLKAAGENVDVVQERVRYSPFKFNDESTVETAYWLYHQQICRELEAIARGFNFVICDRASIDCIIYARYHEFESNMLYKLEAAADEWMLTYDKIFLIRPDTPIALDGVRSPVAEFRNKIDEMFKEYFDKFKLTNKLNNQFSSPKVVEVLTSEIINKEFDYGWIF